MKKELYLIPYSFKSVKMTREEQMKAAKEIGFDGLEGVRLDDEGVELLEKYGLKTVNTTLEMKEDGTPDETCLERMKKYCANDIVRIPDPGAMERMRGMFGGNTFKGLPGQFKDFETAKQAAVAANKDARIAAKFGFKTMYHNHTHEFRVDNGEYILDTYLRHSDPNHVMELDVGWALTAGIDPIYFMKKWAGRIGCLHIKSCNWALTPEALGMISPLDPDFEISRDRQAANQAYAESPQGPMELSIIDWAEVIKVAESIGCTTFIIERERLYNDPQDIMGCLKGDHDWIRKCMG